MPAAKKASKLLPLLASIPDGMADIRQCSRIQEHGKAACQRRRRALFIARGKEKGQAPWERHGIASGLFHSCAAPTELWGCN